MAATDFVSEAQLDALSAAIVGDVNSVRAKIGNLASLSTAAKGSLVAAVNEIHAALTGSAGINDGATGASTTWSSTKISTELAATATAVAADLRGGVGAAYDTLNELWAEIQADNTDLANLLTALTNRVRFDAAQTLTAPQKAQALANLGIVTSAQNFAADYTAAVV